MTSNRFFTCLVLITLLSLVGCAGKKQKESEYFIIQQTKVESQTKAEPQTNVQWPYTVVGKEATVTFYEPQISEWNDYKHIKALLAVSVKKGDEDKTIFGVLQLEADTGVDFVSRQVFLSNLGVTDIRFPELGGESVKKMIDFVKGELIQQSRPVNLDLVLASVADTQTDIKPTAVNIEPPEIFYRAQSARLLLIDGKPLESVIKNNEDLAFVVNTNWDLFKDNQSGNYFLLEKDRWLSAPDVKGPWRSTDKVPDTFSRLPNSDMWKETLAHVPAKTWGEETAPEIIVSFSPAELIVTDGKPEMTPIEGTTLNYVSNTESDLFRAGKKGLWYYLVAGRWFSSKGLTGPWKYAAPSLPEDFRLIPPDHAMAHVLANVPGTMESSLAIIQAQIPVKAEINRHQASVNVTYAGEPKFEKIQGTDMYYAVNTSYDVIRYKDAYYVCYQGVWFVGLSPKGVFAVATAVPSEIYDIPPNHPLHHLTYVTIYEVKEEYVTTGYTAGYHHHYVYSGVVVWGTGWYYPPYWYYDYYYPIYYHYPYTYGIGSSYNPVTGTYRQAGAIYGPYGGYGRSAMYNPETGSYGRARYAWDSNSGYGIGQAYNPRTGTSVFTEQAYDDYQRWGDTVIRRGDEWAQITKYGDERGTIRDIETSKGGEGVHLSDGDSRAFLGKSGEGDIYAGKDGSVYKRDEDGWHKREDGDWAPVDEKQMQQAREQLDLRKEQTGQKLSEKGYTGEKAKERMEGRSTGDIGSRAGSDQTESINRDQRASRANTYEGLERDRRARSESQMRSSRYQSQGMNRGSYRGSRGSFRGRR